MRALPRRIFPLQYVQIISIQIPSWTLSASSGPEREVLMTEEVESHDKTEIITSEPAPLRESTSAQAPPPNSVQLFSWLPRFGLKPKAASASDPGCANSSRIRQRGMAVARALLVLFRRYSWLFGGESPPREPRSIFSETSGTAGPFNQPAVRDSSSHEQAFSCPPPANNQAPSRLSSFLTLSPLPLRCEIA